MKVNERECSQNSQTSQRYFKSSTIFYDAYVAIYKKEIKIFCKWNKKYTK